jgi:hypothetical protein
MPHTKHAPGLDGRLNGRIDKLARKMAKRYALNVETFREWQRESRKEHTSG